MSMNELIGLGELVEKLIHSAIKTYGINDGVKKAAKDIVEGFQNSIEESEVKKLVNKIFDHREE